MRALLFLSILLGCQGTSPGVHPESVVTFKAKVFTMPEGEISPPWIDALQARAMLALKGSLVMAPEILAHKRRSAEITVTKGETTWVLSLRGDLIRGMWEGRVQVRVEDANPERNWRGWRVLTPRPDGKWLIDLGLDPARGQRVHVELQMIPDPHASPFGFMPGAPLPRPGNQSN